MITVEEAINIVQRTAKDVGVEEVPLDRSYGRVLRAPIVADRDFPPFDRVAMDGIAIDHAQFEAGVRHFEVSGIAAAGAAPVILHSSTACIEVMTGAMMPQGADTVIRYEDITIHEGIARINEETIQRRQHIHFQGLDRCQNSLIIPPGKCITAAELSICATVGKSTVKVSKLPKTIVISSGDELVAVNQTPEKYQIRTSNVPMIKTLLAGFSIDATTAHLADDYKTTVNQLREYLKAYDLVILSGGVSMGKFDYLPRALQQLGATQLFHRVKQRPGKPFWFGVYDETRIFAFPGNPVSAFMCALHYLKPWVSTSIQEEVKPQPYAILTEHVTFRPDLTYFLQVSIDYDEDGRLLARPMKGNGSGDLANLADTDAFIRLPQRKFEFRVGEAYPVTFYR